MTGTNETDWAYLLALAGIPILFTAVMIWLYIYTRRRSRRPPPDHGRPD